jgi:MFS family permease
MATFFSIFPGLVVSPIAGALLDRHGRTRLVVLDYVAALVSLTLLGALSLAGALPAWLLLLIAGLSSLTMPLSGTGLRSLFPLIVPVHLWERVNAIDSTGFVAASIVGPPVAAAMVAIWGGAVTFIVIGVSFGLAAFIIGRAPDPSAPKAANGKLLHDAWRGLVYTWRNPTLRGLGFSISIQNVLSGTFNIVVPLLVVQRLRLDEFVVGLVFAAQGLAGMLSAIVIGRIDSRNRERAMLALPMAGAGLASAILLAQPGLWMLLAVMVITGLLNGPLDVAMFTLRQRRTDPAWMGRAFAVSMSFNYVGIPVGSALAGIVGAHSIEAAIAFGIAMSLLGSALTFVFVPETE